MALTGLVVTIACSGCGTAGHGQGAGSSPSTTTIGATVTSQVATPDAGSPTTSPGDVRIAADLLTLQDLPPGWSLFKGAHGAGPQNRGCLSELTTSDGRLSRAQVQFQGGTEDSEYIDEILESFGAGGALAEMAHYRQVLAACTLVSVAAGGLSFTGRITTISLPTLGDDSTAYRVDLTADAGTIPITLGYGLVIARRDNTVLVLVTSSVDPTPVDQMLQPIAGAAMARVT